MAPRLLLARCPNCGAPLDLSATRTAALCLFCNASLRVAHTDSDGATATLAPRALSPEELEHVKHLVLHDREAEAIAHYARAAQVSPDEAESAVKSLHLKAWNEISRHMPLNAAGLVGFVVVLALLVGATAWAAEHTAETPWLWAVVALFGLLSLGLLRRLLRHLRSTLVRTFGATGRGRVVGCTQVGTISERDAYVLAVVFEVTPDAGGAPFVDRELLSVSAAVRDKLVVGNTVRVRFNGGRTLVFPTSPVTVL